MIRRWLVLLASGIVALAIGRYFDPVLRIDGYSGALESTIFPEDTEYAKGYSHSKFLRIRRGMSTDLVGRMLGPPLLTVQGREELSSFYSISPSGSHYRLREVRSSEGKVLQVIAHYYID